MKLVPAERLLKSYGITNPNQIDLEAIAYDQGVTVKYRPLTGCQARILGHGNGAIITVKSGQSCVRQRFSTAHELGHWHHHRGKILTCRLTDIGNHTLPPMNRERVADRYAANLLLPPYLFCPMSYMCRESTFRCVEALAEEFRTSITSTAIQIVDHGPEILLLVCYGIKGRKWFRRGKDMPDRWFPKQWLDRDSYAFDLLHGSERRSGRNLVPANAWFDDGEANDYHMYEDSFKIGNDEVLSILVFRDNDALKETA